MARAFLRPCVHCRWLAYSFWHVRFDWLNWAGWRFRDWDGVGGSTAKDGTHSGMGESDLVPLAIVDAGETICMHTVLFFLSFGSLGCLPPGRLDLQN